MDAQMLLRDSEIFPSEEVLKNVLESTIYYNVLKPFISTITSDEYSLIVEWRYYNDGKAWLGKIVYKKKTVLWLSVWDGFFRIGFYFTEKHIEAIAALDIPEEIKEKFCTAKPIGKLIPMIFDVNNENQLADLLTVVRFKKCLK